MPERTSKFTGQAFQVVHQVLQVSKYNF